MPPLQSLLKLTQKTTKKLQCLNLYSQMDKRQFDMQIQQQNIYAEITQLYKAVTSVLTDIPPTPQQTVIIQKSFQKIRSKYSNTFDALKKQQDILNLQFTGVEMFLKQSETTGSMMIKQVKQIDEYQHEEEQNEGKYWRSEEQDQYNETLIEPTQVKISKLKQQIDTIQRKISLLNYGKGKWFDTDHKDFLKIYNRCNGIDKKIINQGIKTLGMNQTQIMDHLELYQNYLQLEKQKKLVSQEYRQIKLIEQEDNREKLQQKQQLLKLEEKLKKQKQFQERLKKKQQISRYKQKKLQQKQKMVQKQQNQKQKHLRIPPLQPQKKNQIIERNKLMLENQQQKILQSKIKKQSMQKGKIFIQSKYLKSAQKRKSSQVVQDKKILNNDSINKNKN